MQEPRIESGKCWIGLLLGSKWPDGQSRWRRGEGGGRRGELIGMWQRPKLKACVLCSGGGGAPGVPFTSVDGTSEDDLQTPGVWALEEGTLDTD